jgi:phage head maturation protease
MKKVRVSIKAGDVEQFAITFEVPQDYTTEQIECEVVHRISCLLNFDWGIVN